MNKLTMFFFSQKTIQLMSVGDYTRSCVQERTMQRCSLTSVLPVSQSDSLTSLCFSAAQLQNYTSDVF